MNVEDVNVCVLSICLLAPKHICPRVCLRVIHLHRHVSVCCGCFILSVSRVCLCHVCDRSLTSRVKENGGESAVFYYKVERQMKEVGEIVLSVRIRP